MIVIPAIDLKKGQCVRLLQGDMDRSTIFSNDPAKVAKKWEDKGAELIHVVDLDGSFAGSPRNREKIEEILRAVKVPVQLGGGIRDLATIDQYMEMGVNRVILGTVALEDPELVKEACTNYPGRILVGIDAKDGQVAVRGWTEVTGKKAVDIAKEMEGFGAAAFVFTDIKRDGMQTGPNTQGTQELARSISVPVIASGGVNTITDIENIMLIEKDGVMGIIVGRALYSESLRLEDAVKLTKREG